MTGAWTWPAPFSRFSISKVNSSLAQSLRATSSSKRLAGTGENVHLHQVMDDLVRLETELGREVLDDDRRLDDDDLVLELLRGDGLLIDDA